MENLTVLNLKNLDKSQWKTYRFDEIAKNISERVDPNNTDLEVYVGLEHIDSESIHLKRSGTPDDVDGQKLRFYPGDVIFGRRRAYLRKAAVAKTHGFCSAHALVLRANPNVIDPNLFPFFLHSNLFMHRAVDISVGSLSPTINWGTLKGQIFKLPSNDQQLELLELLTELDKVVDLNNTLQQKLEVSFKVFSQYLLGDGKSKGWTFAKLSNYFEKITTKNKGIISSNVLTISAKDGLISQEDYFNRNVASKDLSNYFLLNKGDFAYNKSYSLGYPAGAIKVLEKYSDGVVSPLYICFRPKCDVITSDYFKYLFESGYLNSKILAIAKEGARNHGLLNVASEDFFNLEVPVPPSHQIPFIINKLRKIESSVLDGERHHKLSKKMLVTIINSIF